MKGRELYDSYVAAGGIEMEPVEVRVERLVDELIRHLYRPDLELMCKLDDMRCEALGVDTSEPANWGSLGCAAVKEYKDGSFDVVLDEASPDACPTLCEYVTKYMAAWGWKVHVSTEW